MRWIRRRALIAAAFILPYYFISYSTRDGFAVSVAFIACALIIFGCAFIDRLFFDPSAIFINKPWRMMQPSSGDVFRIVVLGVIVGVTLPIVILRSSYRTDAAIFEGGLISLFLFLYEVSRHRVERVRWHGSSLDVRSKFGKQVAMRWMDVTSVKRGWFGDYLVFRDKMGQKARISRNLKGYSEFIRDAERYVSPALQNAVKKAK